MALDLAPCSGTCAHHQVEASFEALFVQLPAIEHSWLAVKLVHSKAESLLRRAMPRTLFVFSAITAENTKASERMDGACLSLPWKESFKFKNIRTEGSLLNTT